MQHWSLLLPVRIWTRATTLSDVDCNCLSCGYGLFCRLLSTFRREVLSPSSGLMCPGELWQPRASLHVGRTHETATNILTVARASYPIPDIPSLSCSQRECGFPFQPCPDRLSDHSISSPTVTGCYSWSKAASEWPHNTLSPSDQFKNAWSYTSTSPYALTTWCLIHHSDMFTFLGF